MSTVAFAQFDPLQFVSLEHITKKQGLPDNNMDGILQDKKGFMWFLSNEGLDRYDGYTFKNYIRSPQHPDYLAPGVFNRMTMDRSGIIWIGDYNNGFYSFDPLTEKFVHYVHQRGNANSTSDNSNYDILADKIGNVWIATPIGLDELNPRTGVFRHFHHRAGDPSSIGNNFVTALCEDENNKLWIATSAPGIDYFDPVEGKVIKHFEYGSTFDFTSIAANEFSRVTTGRNGNIWIGTIDNGLFCYNTRTQKAQHFLRKENDPYSISNGWIWSAYEDRAGNAWIITGNQTLDFYDHATRKFYRADSLLNTSLFQLYEIFEDTSNKIWMICGNGIFTLDPKLKKIQTCRHSDKDPHSISSNECGAVFRDSHGQLYVPGTNFLDVFDDSLKNFNRLPIWNNGIDLTANNILITIYEDDEKKLWIGTLRGLIHYDPVTKKSEWFSHDSRDSTTISANAVNSILKDRRGRYWMTAVSGGLNSFDPLTKKFRAFKVSNSMISSDDVGGINEDSRGILYMVSQGGGLIAFNADSETFKIYKHRDNDPQSISSDDTNDFLETPNGIIWVGTAGGGIDAFNPATGKFRAFTTADGFCSNNVDVPFQDKEGNLWVSSDKGISRFLPPPNPFDSKATLHIRNYNSGDGFSSESINNRFKDADGKMFFSPVSDGFFCFYPDDLKDNPFIPPVYITSFALFNHEVYANDSTHILTSPIEDTKEIKLKYSDNVISFSFAALNYIHPENNKYAYKLDGFDKSWIYTDATKHFANYTNLDPGDYTFEVKGSNNDGIWNKTPARIHLSIIPPWWNTWWFRILIVLVVTTIVYGIYRYRISQILKLQLVRNRIARDLHDEVGSTLSSVSIYSEVVLRKTKDAVPEVSPILKEIHDNTNNMMESISDIVWTINSKNDQFENIVARMNSFAVDLLEAKHCTMHFQADAKLDALKLNMEVRKNFYLIFKEAMNNIAKYAEAKNVWIDLRLDHSWLHLKIKDDGKGFAQTKNSHGNGLRNMKHRAELLKGKMEITSEIGSGTMLLLEFPVHS
ncbi:MAG TPA: two-component regulator propeller domain-containing protein [Chitinophagales bacterium]|nr:two-component regulator propeller domain-containing protein [Chitinophagales bacterium]